MQKIPLFRSYDRSGHPKPRIKRRFLRRWWWKLPLGFLAINIGVLLLLRWMPPPTTAFMLQTSAPKSGVRYQWVPWNRISPHLPIAVVAAEDQKFPDHSGFDFESIEKAIKENKYRRRPRGASTITQQVAKNLFLWSGRSYLRKGLEAYLTVMIEIVWSKQRILEVYLNIAQFGPGVYGAEAAGRAYFNKSAVRLHKNDAAILAAVLPNPNRLKAGRPSDYVYRRAFQIRQQMDRLGGITYLQGVWPNR